MREAKLKHYLREKEKRERKREGGGMEIVKVRAKCEQNTSKH